MQRNSVGALVLFVSAIGWIAATERGDAIDVEPIDVEPIDDRTWALRTETDNLVVTRGPSGPVVIGNGAGSLGDAVRAEVAKLDERPLQCFVVTHEREASPAMANDDFTIAHDETAARMQENGRGAELRFRSRLTLALGDETLTCHFKGTARTRGDAIAHLSRARVLAVGALVENGRHPMIHTGDDTDLRGWIRVLRELERDFHGQDIVVVPARGPRGGVEILTEQADYLDAVLDAMETAQRHGLSRDEALRRAAPLRARFGHQGDGFESLAELAYDIAGR